MANPDTKTSRPRNRDDCSHSISRLVGDSEVTAQKVQGGSTSNSSSLVSAYRVRSQGNVETNTMGGRIYSDLPESAIAKWLI